MASEKITAIIESVKGLTVLELKELIDTYCEEFGVSAVAAAAPAAAGAAAPAEEEKTEFDVVLYQQRQRVILQPRMFCQYRFVVAGNLCQCGDFH